jgi:hypothetical protein
MVVVSRLEVEDVEERGELVIAVAPKRGPQVGKSDARMEARSTVGGTGRFAASRLRSDWSCFISALSFSIRRSAATTTLDVDRAAEFRIARVVAAIRRLST